MAHTPKNQSEKAILTARRAWCYLVLVLISFLCLFFFYVLIINSTRTHFEIQKGFSLMPGKSIITNFRNVLTAANIPVVSGIRNSLLVSACSAARAAVVLSLIVVLLSFGDVEGEHHAAGDRGDALELEVSAAAEVQGLARLHFGEVFHLVLLSVKKRCPPSSMTKIWLSWKSLVTRAGL